MSRNKGNQLRQDSFVSDFLGTSDAETLAQSSRTGNIAIAKDNARQIIGNIITNYFEQPGDAKVDREWLKVIEWLTPSKQALDIQALIHRDARGNQADGTGAWFVTAQSFQDWLAGSSNLKWIHGIVGCGKTVLFSSAVEKTRDVCRQDPTRQSCFFYCTSRDPSGQDVTVLLRLLLIQLCRPQRVIEPLRKLYDACNEMYPPKTPTVRELSDAIRAIFEKNAPNTNDGGSSKQTDQTNHPSHTYLLIDGLDEVPWAGRLEFFQFLSALTALELRHLHLLVTSRTQPDIQEAMTELVLWDQIKINEAMVQPDILLYVSHAMEANSRLKRLSETTKEAVRERVANQGKGM